jgi:23S rRNA (pseudouridine1915-N3)-methyltransferase
MKLRMVWVGKTRESFLDEGIRLFRERIRRYVALETVIVRGEKIRSGANETLPEGSGGRAPGSSRLPGRPRSSPSTRPESSLIRKPSAAGWENIEIGEFVPSRSSLGSPLGLSEEILQRADFRFSLSPMTFTHEMARLILMEQVYRAMTILAGEKYHK